MYLFSRCVPPSATKLQAAVWGANGGGNRMRATVLLYQDE